MGKYDDISPEALRAELVRFARLVLELEENDALLTSVAEMQRLIGDLRRALFAYEVRRTADLPGEPAEDRGPEQALDDQDPVLQESLRVVREALEREKEMREELDRGFPPADEDDD